MKVVSRIILVLILVAVVPASAVAASGGLRYSITVSRFDNQSGWHGQWDLGDAWGTVLTDLLNQTGKFIVLGEPDMRNAAMNEQDLAAAGRTAGGRLQVGRVLLLPPSLPLIVGDGSARPAQQLAHLFLGHARLQPTPGALVEPQGHRTRSLLVP